MVDAFGKKLAVGNKVIYGTKHSGGTNYVIGHIIELIDDKFVQGCQIDQVRIKVKATSREVVLKNPVVYASNVVLFK